MTETMYSNCLQGYAPQPFMPARKAEWVAALRSGEFKQGPHYLRTADDMFCCMGVALNLIDPNGWDEPIGLNKTRSWKDCEAVMLGEPLRQALNLDVKVVRELSTLNDSALASFGEIADWIEKTL